MSSSDDIPGQESSDTYPFACVRCWKQKKKCDKLAPKCGRCGLSNTRCIYSLQPPTGRMGSDAAALNSPSQTQIESSRSFQNNTGSSMAVLASILTQLASGSMSREQPEFDHSLRSQVYTILASIKDDIECTCTTYINTINTWIPIIIEDQLLKQLIKFQINPDPDIALLILSIYLVTHTPTNIKYDRTDTDLLYSTLKPFHARMASMTRPSIPIIQAGILISVFEYGHGWEQTGYLSIGVCTRMAHAMSLHKTLFQDPPDDAAARATFETCKHVWWSIVILERLLALETVDSNRPFATKDPSLDDLLPSFQGRDIEAQLRVGKTTHIESASSNIASDLNFPLANPYARSAQATYLLSRVINQIRSDQPSDTLQAEVAYLDKSLQSFLFSVLEQANQDSELGWGHSCGAYMIANSALWILHKHKFSLESAYKTGNARRALENDRPEPPSISSLALQSLTRIVIDSSRSKFDDPIVGAKYTPPYAFYCMYEAGKFHIEGGCDKQNQAQWIDDIRSLSHYLAIGRQKWTVAGRYLDEISNHSANPYNATVMP